MGGGGRGGGRGVAPPSRTQQGGPITIITKINFKMTSKTTLNGCPFGTLKRINLMICGISFLK